MGYETTYSDVYGDSSKIPETVYAPKFGTEKHTDDNNKKRVKNSGGNNISEKEKIMIKVCHSKR